jgi:hypothetical protein
MKYTYFFKLPILLAILTFCPVFPGYAHGNFPMPNADKIHKPFVPISESKKYKQQLEELQQLLNAKDNWKFYNKAWDMSKVISQSNSRDLAKMVDKDFAVAFMWLSYFIATAPYLTYNEPERPGGGIWDDEDIKFTQIGMMKYLGRKLPSFFGSRAGDARMLLREYSLYTIDSFHLAYATAQKECASIAEARYSYFGEIRKEYEAYLKPSLEKSKNSFSDELWNLGAFWSKKEAGLESATFHSLETRIDLFISVSGKNAARLHEQLTKAGYKDKDARHRILLKVVGRDKNTEWMYAGIPKSETKKLQEAYLLKKNAKPPATKQEATKQEPKKTEPKK